ALVRPHENVSRLNLLPHRIRPSEDGLGLEFQLLLLALVTPHLVSGRFVAMKREQCLSGRFGLQWSNQERENGEQNQDVPTHGGTSITTLCRKRDASQA